MARSRRPSPALVVALLALLVALSSSAGASPVAIVAKTLSGSSIKPHSIPLSALSPAAVKQLRGAPGPKGDAGATNLSVVAQTCGPAPCTSATAACPAGARATGGGGIVVGNQLLFESQPITTNGTPTSWAVAGGAASPPSTGTLTAYAVCASP